MEPMAGIEPATDGLRNRCSTTELHWRPNQNPPALPRELTGLRDGVQADAGIVPLAAGKYEFTEE